MGRSPCPTENKVGVLKKGAWTAEEDQKLISFIDRNNGHGSWRTLPQLAGLQRCGKSCRLRWTNYLRPNIKRGNFTVEEEWTIRQLHALLGNKWSSIAARLVGRTDNEVKNHWNTHLRKQFSGMGINPVTHRRTSLSLANVKPLKDDNMMKQRRQFNINDCSSFTCNPQKRPLPRNSVLDQSYVNHMAQWESARLEAESRQMAAGVGKGTSAAASPSEAGCLGGSTRQTWAQTARRGQDVKETDQLLESMLRELVEATHEVEAAPGPIAAHNCLQDMTSHSSSSAGSYDQFFIEADISSELTSLVYDLSSPSSSPSPPPHDLLTALVPASPLLPPCSEPIYWANVFSLMGPIISPS